MSKSKKLLLLCVSIILGLSVFLLPCKNNQQNLTSAYSTESVVLDDGEEQTDPAKPSEPTEPTEPTESTEPTEPETELYTLTLVYGMDFEDDTFSLEAGTSLNLVDPNAEGYDFGGWFEDDGFTIPLEVEVMPEADLTIFAKLTPKIFNVTYHYNNGLASQTINAEYGMVLTEPAEPARLGFDFEGWFVDESLENKFDFSSKVTENINLYAKWSSTKFKLEFVLNNGGENQIELLTYEEEILRPADPTFKNHRFINWYEDENFTRIYVFRNASMPAENVKIYAKWEEKAQIPFSAKQQTYEYGDIGAFYRNLDSRLNFYVEYKVDGKWTNEVPKNAGSYDVRVSRHEDATYASFEQVVENGFVISHREINLVWLIIVLFLIFILEVFAIIFVKRLKNIKTRMYALLPVVVGGNSIIPNNQFILLLISGALAIFGLVYLIYVLVDVNRTARNDAYLPSKLDNRERFKDELTFQNTNEGDTDYVTKTKTNESFGEKYSASDIKNMLSNDTFKKETLERRKFNTEDNSETNWNKNSNNKGSDVVSRAKDFNSLYRGDYDGKTTTKFFDDEE